MRITFHDADCRFHIAPRGALGTAETAPVRQPLHDEWQARTFLLRHLRDAFALGALRRALACELDGLVRYSDEDVISAAVARLASGRWSVIREDGIPPGPAVIPRQHAGGADAGSAAPGRTQASAQAPQPQNTPQGAAAAEWANQAAQARTLEQAARFGTPFCEVCAAAAGAAHG